MYIKKENQRFVIKDFIKELIPSLKNNDISMLSAQTSFNLIIGMIPFSIIIINILLNIASSQIHLITDFIQYLHPDLKNIANEILDFILTQKSTGALSFGILAVLWTSSREMKSLIKSLNMAFRQNESTFFIYTQIKALIFTLLIVLVFAVLLLALVFGNTLINWFFNFFNIEMLRIYFIAIDLLRLLIPFILMIIAFTIIYMFGPTFNKYNIPPFLPCLIGGTIATIITIIITLGYAIFINYFSNIASIYGPLVGIMILFLWTNYIVTTIIVSGEITAAIIRYSYDFDDSEIDEGKILKNKINTALINKLENILENKFNGKFKNIFK